MDASASHACTICHKSLSRHDNLVRHMNTVHGTQDTGTRRFACQLCDRSYTRKYDMERHQQSVHNITTSVAPPAIIKSKSHEEFETQVIQEIATLRDKIDKQATTPTNTNVLQIVCVTPTDNYLDLLTASMGDFNQAIEYIKECALSDLSGDCKLIEKVYIKGVQDVEKSSVTYINEKRERVTEKKLVFVRKIANNLQNSYLKGINFLIKQNLERHGDPNKFLDSFDLMEWNAHIFRLSESPYQTQLSKQLEFPTVSL
jgi:hypothetical protein